MIQKIKEYLPVLLIAAVLIALAALSSTQIYTGSPSVSSSTPLTASPSLATSSAATTSASAPAKKEDPAVVAARNLTIAGGNLLRASVNIYCVPKGTTNISGASGSGVLIDSRGLIITAAHIGQYFLLADSPKRVNCTIRTGSPAADAYTAQLVYLSPSWLEANPQTLIEKAPKGTGENDFAILAITGSATNTPLPASFPFVPLGTDVPSVGQKVAIGGYAAQYLSNDTIKSALFPTLVFDAITNRYTFDTDTIDVLSIAGTAAAQEGSSGGGLSDSNNQLVGVITTSSISGDISQHTLHAIAMRHIRASFAGDTGNKTLDGYLSAHDINTLIANFADEAKTLRSLLLAAISK